MTHFPRRVGEQAQETLLQETLPGAHRAGPLSEQLGAQAKKTGLR